MNASKNGVVLKSLAVTAVIFGVLTVFSGGRALFGGEEAARAAGAIVSFVLWFNFVAGFAYVASGLGLWRRNSRRSSQRRQPSCSRLSVCMYSRAAPMKRGPSEPWCCARCSG